MKKTFCDICGQEFKPDFRTELFSGGKIDTHLNRKVDGLVQPYEVKVEVRASSSFESVDTCHRCMWSVIDKIDPRAKPCAT